MEESQQRKYRRQVDRETSAELSLLKSLRNQEPILKTTRPVLLHSKETTRLPESEIATHSNANEINSDQSHCFQSNWGKYSPEPNSSDKTTSDSDESESDGNDHSESEDHDSDEERISFIQFIISEMYSIVTYPDEQNSTALVSTSWISLITKWPPYKSSTKFDASVRNRETPGPEWSSCRCRVLKSYGQLSPRNDYTFARTHGLTRSNVSSDLNEMEDDGLQSRIQCFKSVPNDDTYSDSFDVRPKKRKQMPASTGMFRLPSPPLPLRRVSQAFSRASSNPEIIFSEIGSNTTNSSGITTVEPTPGGVIMCVEKSTQTDLFEGSSLGDTAFQAYIVKKFNEIKGIVNQVRDLALNITVSYNFHQRNDVAESNLDENDEFDTFLPISSEKNLKAFDASLVEVSKKQKLAIQESKKKPLQESTLADFEKSISAYIVHAADRSKKKGRKNSVPQDKSFNQSENE
ncbi:unnamed protein product [Allacma fusca]|uniref:Uncharacterized protein n=1 Tax=Allacma fusca TaxID=39272 RepID=A0A8J2PGU7_9HEXA|nr:unnamed protein product [Allacma fusca]